MAQGPEEKIVRKIIHRIHNDPRPSYTRKVHGSRFQTGEPDIDAVVDGWALKLEVKTPGGKPTALQASKLRTWEKAGAFAACVHSVAEVEQILDGLPPGRFGRPPPKLVHDDQMTLLEEA